MNKKQKRNNNSSGNLLSRARMRQTAQTILLAGDNRKIGYQATAMRFAPSRTYGRVYNLPYKGTTYQFIEIPHSSEWTWTPGIFPHGPVLLLVTADGQKFSMFEAYMDYKHQELNLRSRYYAHPKGIKFITSFVARQVQGNEYFYRETSGSIMSNEFLKSIFSGSNSLIRLSAYGVTTKKMIKASEINAQRVITVLNENF